MTMFSQPISLALTMAITGLVMTGWPISPIASAQTQPIRIAHYNVSLYGKQSGEVAARLASGTDEQAMSLARVIQSVRPDVLLLCEIDYDADGRTLNEFADRYLAVAHAAPGLTYPHRWSIPTNTGELSSIDLNADKKIELPADAHGFGVYPGQYAMAILSRFPIDRDAIRTFQKYRWSQLPDALRPPPANNGETDQAGEYFHSDEVWKQLRLSSKNHVDVPIALCGLGQTQRLHLLASHPTPPVFDGAEDLNGRRNHDEIRLWTDYISDSSADHLIDDSGASGGLKKTDSFVVLGDLNSDPNAGDSRREAIVALLGHPRVRNTNPLNASKDNSTALFGSRRIRVDYVLPSRDLDVLSSGVVWPEDNQPLAKDITATDHRMVWIDVRPSCNP